MSRAEASYLNSSLESLCFNRVSVPDTKFIHVCNLTSLAINTPGCVAFYSVFRLLNHVTNNHQVLYQQSLVKLSSIFVLKEEIFHVVDIGYLLFSVPFLINQAQFARVFATCQRLH